MRNTKYNFTWLTFARYACSGHIETRTSNVEYRKSNENGIANIAYRMTHVECSISNIECWRSNIECWISNMEWRSHVAHGIAQGSSEAKREGEGGGACWVETSEGGRRARAEERPSTLRWAQMLSCTTMSRNVVIICIQHWCTKCPYISDQNGVCQ